jgi:hypothetical protein
MGAFGAAVRDVMWTSMEELGGSMNRSPSFRSPPAAPVGVNRLDGSGQRSVTLAPLGQILDLVDERLSLANETVLLPIVDRLVCKRRAIEQRHDLPGQRI